MERLEPPSPRAEELDEAAVPAERDPARLKALIAEARLLTVWEQKRVAGDINALLVAMRAPGNEAAEARAVLEQLELSTLDGLVDQSGRTCRAEAVETLLACGFPHALEVRPEDLDHHREAAEPPMNALLLFGLSASALALVIGTFTLAVNASFGESLLVLGGAVSALAPVLIGTTRARRRKAARGPLD